MNINVISCLNKLFSIKGIINNIGFYFFIILIVICIILFIFFGIKIIQILYKVNKMLFSKENNMEKSCDKNQKQKEHKILITKKK